MAVGSLELSVSPYPRWEVLLHVGPDNVRGASLLNVGGWFSRRPACIREFVNSSVLAHPGFST